VDTYLMSFFGDINVGIKDSPHIDAFGRLRVSNPHTLFESALIYDKQELLWNEKLTGTATSTFQSNKSQVKLSCGTSSGDKAIRQSKRYSRYQPGKSLLIFLTGVIGISKTNVKQRIGYFDDRNGVFFEQSSTGISLVLRSYTSGSAVNTTISQNNWTLDTLDGNGNSEINLDFSKTQIFVFDLEWLGVGRVRCGVVIDGLIYYCHQFLNANNKTEVYMSMASLPCRFEIENVGVAASNTDLYQICSTVLSEGGYLRNGYVFSAHTGTSTVAITGRYPVFAIRSKLTFGGVINRSHIYPVNVALFSAGNKDVIYELCFGGSLSGTPSWTSVNTNSTVEYWKGNGSTTLSGEVVLKSGRITSKETLNIIDIASKIIGSTNIDATDSDLFTIVCEPILSSADIFVALEWREDY
jgi:hypothetical protein